LSFVLSKKLCSNCSSNFAAQVLQSSRNRKSIKNAVSESLLLPCEKMLCQKLREYLAAFRLAVTQTLQTAACGKKPVNSAANHLPNKSLKGAREARWTRCCAARPLARR
jgi:hypothetical protein